LLLVILLLARLLLRHVLHGVLRFLLLDIFNPIIKVLAHLVELLLYRVTPAPQPLAAKIGLTTTRLAGDSPFDERNLDYRLRPEE
jgi:hypothetical protein